MVQTSSIHQVPLASVEDKFPSHSAQTPCLPSNTQTLLQALILLSVFGAVEFSIGIWSHSLSLVSDAEHVLSDIAALGIALGANWLACSNWEFFKKRQLEVWVALFNALSLAVIAIWIINEAIARLQSPDLTILGSPMLGTAIVGLIINGFNIFCLQGCAHQNLNLRGAFVHLLADLVGSLGAVLAAIAIVWLHWTWADGVIGLVVAGIIAALSISLLLNCVRSLRDSGSGSFLKFCNCSLGAQHGSERQSAEKLLFPTLEDKIW